jgi:dephospho-CoA kinase
MSQFVVGISGGIGSGKTTVTDMFAEYGIDVIDADVIARQVVEPGSDALTAIVQKFGPSIVQDDGHLNRQTLRAMVFSDAALKTWLNNLLHPLIREQMQEQTLAARSSYCLLSVPLLVENKLTTLVDRVLIVDVSEEIQIERSVLRDKSNADQIRAIMRAQASRAERLACADDVVNNEGSLRELRPQVEKLHARYLRLSQGNTKSNNDSKLQG